LLVKGWNKRLDSWGFKEGEEGKEKKKMIIYNT